MTRKGRGREDLRRKAPRLQPRACILIVCEGLKTEPSYFESLRRKLRIATAEVEVVGQGAAPISVVDEAVTRKKKRQHEASRGRQASGYDQVWCVLDVEQAGMNSSLPAARDKAQANKVRLALSNPCFEYWYLLHFKSTGRHFANCKAVCSALKKHLPSYQKGKDVFPAIEPHTDVAIQNAKEKETQQWQHQDDPAARNPSTQVYQLVEELRKIVRTSR